MAKRHRGQYIGIYHHSRRGPKQPVSPQIKPNGTTSGIPITQLSAMAVNYFWTAYSAMNGNYVAITIFFIVLLSFILPDLSQKIHRHNELKAMKKVLRVMSSEVSRAEVACLTVANDLCTLHCSMHDDTTETLKDQQDLSVCTSGCMRTTQSAPVQVDKRLGFFRRIFFPHKNTSHKEVAIMSYIYTDSFDDDQSLQYSSSISECITD